MTLPRFIAAAAVAAALTGCASNSTPAPAVELKVIAKPKRGAEEPFPRPPIYDAGPQIAVYAGSFEHVDYRNLDNVIVWLEPNQPAAITPPLTNATLTPTPGIAAHDITPLSVGGQLTLTNHTATPLALYSVSDGNEFEYPAIAPGAGATFTPKAEGLIEVLSRSDQPPVALLYAAPGAKVINTKAGRTLAFPAVPPGSYIARSWHPRLPAGALPLTVPPSPAAPVKATLLVGVDALATGR